MSATDNALCEAGAQIFQLRRRTLVGFDQVFPLKAVRISIRFHGRGALAGGASGSR